VVELLLVFQCQIMYIE